MRRNHEKPWRRTHVDVSCKHNGETGLVVPDTDYADAGFLLIQGKNVDSDENRIAFNNLRIYFLFPATQ